MSKKNLVSLIVAVVIIIVGGIFLSTQKPESINSAITDDSKISQDTESENGRGDDLMIDESGLELKYDYCVTQSRITDSGREIYPINKDKYKNLSSLGSIFTAYDCGSSRLNELFGGASANYDLGSAIWLKRKPSESLISLFKEIGFSCGDKDLLDEECIKWELFDSVNLEQLIKLQPFHFSFEIDDCRNCG